MKRLAQLQGVYVPEFYSSRPDPDTGIGRWSEEAFVRAMRQGIDRVLRWQLLIIPPVGLLLLLRLAPGVEPVAAAVVLPAAERELQFHPVFTAMRHRKADAVFYPRFRLPLSCNRQVARGESGRRPRKSDVIIGLSGNGTTGRLELTNGTQVHSRTVVIASGALSARPSRLAVTARATAAFRTPSMLTSTATESSTHWSRMQLCSHTVITTHIHCGMRRKWKVFEKISA